MINLGYIIVLDYVLAIYVYIFGSIKMVLEKILS